MGLRSNGVDAMKAIPIAIVMTLLSGCASTGRSDFVYFPDLADKVLAGDAQAFRQVLSRAQVTEPGERLEELSEIASRFVRISPKEFLRGESDEPHCFGVSFSGRTTWTTRWQDSRNSTPAGLPCNPWMILP
jgi:hypothetical protein